MSKRDRHERFILSSREREAQLLKENDALKAKLRECQQKYHDLLCEHFIQQCDMLELQRTEGA